MDELINYMLQFGHLNTQQIALIKQKLKEVNLKRGDYFSIAGKVPHQVGFVNEGILRVCYYNKDGEEFTYCFMPENRFVVDYNAFINEVPCTKYVEALTDCKLYIFSRADFIELSNTIIGWDMIISKIMSAAMMRKVSDTNRMLNEDATNRYLHFMERNPDLVNRIPLSIVASYLGITQSSLSRIRKNLS